MEKLGEPSEEEEEALEGTMAGVDVAAAMPPKSRVIWYGGDVADSCRSVDRSKERDANFACRIGGEMAVGTKKGEGGMLGWGGKGGTGT